MTIPIIQRDKENLIYFKTVISNKKKLYQKKIKSLKNELNEDLKRWNKALQIIEDKIRKQIENANNEKENLYLNQEINNLDL
tara:strand:- start:55 stop:300 length:246 start_codon:yes stop_codon:yes gene_type:complete